MIPREVRLTLLKIVAEVFIDGSQVFSAVYTDGKMEFPVKITSDDAARFMAQIESQEPEPATDGAGPWEGVPYPTDESGPKDDPRKTLERPPARVATRRRSVKEALEENLAAVPLNQRIDLSSLPSLNLAPRRKEVSMDSAGNPIPELPEDAATYDGVSSDSLGSI